MDQTIRPYIKFNDDITFKTDAINNDETFSIYFGNKYIYIFKDEEKEGYGRIKKFVDLISLKDADVSIRGRFLSSYDRLTIKLSDRKINFDIKKDKFIMHNIESMYSV